MTDATTDAILELQDLCYSYEDSPHALDDVSLSIRQGDKIAVLGRNGAGKSTFFLCCNGVHAPEHGRILFRGKELSRRRADLITLRRVVGIVFQDPNQQLIGSTVEGEISFGPMNLRLPLDEVARRVDASMAAMNVTQLRSRPPHYLSGGEKKRVSIADVLAMEPELILFDEPTASLDPANTEILESVLRQLGESGKTLMVSTHDVDFAWRWANRALVFVGGRVIADSSIESVFTDSELLERAGLGVPGLLRTVQILQASGVLPGGEFYPKTYDELSSLLPAPQRR